MNALAGLRILTHKLVGMFFRTALKPSDVMGFTLKAVEKAVRDSQLQLAELVVARKKAAVSLERLELQPAADPQLAGLLATQLRQYDEQIDELRLLIAKLEQEGALLKARSTSLTVRANLHETQARIQGLMGNLGASSASEVFDRIDDELSHQEAVRKALEEIKRPPPRPELPPGM